MSRQALFGRVEQLVDQVLLYSNVAFHQIRREQFGKLRIVVKRADDALFRHLDEYASAQSRDGRHAQLVSSEALLAEESTGLEDCNNSFLTFLGDHSHLDP